MIIRRVIQALQILLGLLLTSGLIWLLRRLLTRRQAILTTRYQQLTAIAAAEKVQPSEPSDGSDISEGEETEARKILDLRSRFLATVQH
ncbi:hypothetical protein [Leptodesmis sp.]|uniref:hypothetical protein n=1 Tax=Leptodesmis sp. TaxID=3100501 RepID=UPI004053472D